MLRHPILIIITLSIAAVGLCACSPSTGNMQGDANQVADDHPPAPDESTFVGAAEADHNREIYGHAWPQTDREKSADALWQSVTATRDEVIGEGGDYKAYNARLTATYRRWEAAEAQAYGANWRTLWKARHTGDILGECGDMQALGMSRDQCVEMEQAQGDIDPLEPMLLKCSPGGTVMPHDAISCKTHGRRSSYDRQSDDGGSGLSAAENE